MSWLGLDFGAKRIGIAISDPLKIIAVPVGTYNRCGRQNDLDYIAALIAERQIDLVVLGLPINMDGTQGEAAARVKKFGQGIASKSKVRVVYEDERLTSVTANDILYAAGLDYKKRREKVDTMAAQLILQSYLNRSQSNGN